MKINSLTVHLKLRILKIQDGGQSPSWKLLNRHVSATIWLITMTFGMLTHIGPLNAHWPLKFPTFENPRGRTATIWRTVKSAYISNGATDRHEVWQDDTCLSAEPYRSGS